MSQQDQDQPTHNPYSASTFSLDEPRREVSGELVADGRAITVNDAMSWLSMGFDFFKKNPGIWIALTIIYFVVLMVLGLVPFLGFIARSVLAPVLSAGFMLGCLALDQGGELEIEHLFAGFKHNTGKLIMVGVLTLVAYVAVGVVFVGLALVVGVGGAALSGLFAGGSQALPAMMGAGIGVVILMLLMLVAIIPIAMATWFAPALVVFHDLEAVDAMKMSFFGCLKNLLPLFVLGVVLFILAMLSVVTLFLGLLVLIPVMLAAHYFSYKAIFLQE